MTHPEHHEPNDEVRIGDFFAPLLRYRHLIWHATIAATALTVLVGGIYLVVQPVRWAASLGFKPVFAGAAEGLYPNGLPFASSDIIQPVVIDQVYEKNNIADPCTRGEFRSGFVIDESSPELQVLDLEYQARLADTRLSPVDRERLQSEYRTRRESVPTQYALTWVRSQACRNVPDEVVRKALNEILQTWAIDADTKRGVLKLRVAVLTPAIFDTGSLTEQSLLIRADTIRSSLQRVIRNIRDVESLPYGAELIRIGNGDSFSQVRARLEDLVQVHLDPLLGIAGRTMGSDAINWVEASIANAAVRERSAEERANAYQAALREYAGLTAAPVSPNVQSPTSSSDVQTLTPQIDRTFIDRIVELSATNTAFRQEMTRNLVAAKLTTVEIASAARHYEQLMSALRRGAASSINAAEIDRRLTLIVTDAKAQVQKFNELYDEFSRVALNPGPSMFRVESPAQVTSVRQFSVRSLLLLVLAVLIGTPLVVGLGCLIHHAFLQIAKRPLRASRG